MKKLILPIILVLTLSACAQSVDQWAKQRKSEIQYAYDNQEITKAEYLNLMIQVDSTVDSHYTRLQSGVLSSSKSPN